ncbi:S-methyl-5-thioribose-1-phosphate isomerase [bacterium]|nr:S-methyl-5-thioribose-1-phosphate isomerase [candidate division CSSED10-310 bacterium]
MIETIRWDGECLWILDQTKLPFQVVYRKCTDVLSTADSIRSMQVRGAPAIGVTAAFGMVLAARTAIEQKKEIVASLKNAADLLIGTRPTAVNLAWAVKTMLTVVENKIEDVLAQLENKALEIYDADIQSCKRIGKYGSSLLPANATVLTHCNAGALATAGYGTALGVIRSAVEEGKHIRVFVDETRPFLQGARLTAWELSQENIETILIADNMAAYFMSRNEIDAVVVGADRIAANGDTANKIGTYSVALAAKTHGIPFYVAAPWTTVDLGISSGEYIPIEERSPEEISHLQGIPIAAPGVKIRNPAFDVTPAEYITAIITDFGIAEYPYNKSLKKINDLIETELKKRCR